MNPARTYPLIVELELWLPSISELGPLDGKEVAARCQQETGLPSEVVLGLNFVPDEQDTQRLSRTIELKEVKPEKFHHFCEARGLRSSPEDTRSAAEFLVFMRGQSLAWLHLPATPSGLAMAKTLMRWAQKENLAVRDGESTYELLSDEQVYGRWHSAA